tara:strand:+ start:26418 stop:26711 length:294 start_codon:yes stop_codon:yes gene_type:complete
MQTQEAHQVQDETNRPAMTQRHGRLTLTIWPNQTEKGTRYSTEITRTWKDGENYRTTSRLDERDLLVAARLAIMADDWVNAARQADWEHARQNGSPP